MYIDDSYYWYILLLLLLCLFFSSFHPYIFFNQDHDSLTFIGFSITENGDLIDPVSWNVLIRGIVSPKLSRNLRAQGVGVYGHNSDRQ